MTMAMGEKLDSKFVRVLCCRGSHSRFLSDRRRGACNRMEPLASAILKRRAKPDCRFREFEQSTRPPVCGNRKLGRSPPATASRSMRHTSYECSCNPPLTMAFTLRASRDLGGLGAASIRV